MDKSSFTLDLEKRFVEITGREVSTCKIQLWGQDNTARVSGTRWHGSGNSENKTGSVPWDEGNIPALLDLCNRIKTFPRSDKRNLYSSDALLQIATEGTQQWSNWSSFEPVHGQPEGADASDEQRRDFEKAVAMIMAAWNGYAR